MKELKHHSVMLFECIDGLDIKPNALIVDGTVGGGGHSLEIAKRLIDGKLVAIDQDDYAQAFAKRNLKNYIDKILFVNDNFKNIICILDKLSIDKIDGMLLDLGVSSFQLDDGERGFSYNFNAKLDMRMSKDNPLTAYKVVNEYSEYDLKKVIRDYGEENFAAKIAKNIVKKRQEQAITTTFELSEIIKSSIPAKFRREGPHPAKRTFQAIRIEVNSELSILSDTIKDAASKMNTGGRIAIISFHSLEDRIVKNTFNSLANGCVCPHDFPKCVCGFVPQLKIITRKPLLPSKKELEINPRSRSAKLRIAEKI